MKRVLLMVAAAGMLFASCSKDNNSAIKSITADEAALAKKGPQARPFSGSLTYEFSMTENLPCNCGTYAPAGTLAGSGNMSHLGKTTSLIKPCVAPIIQGGQFIGNHVGVECAFFVAANGDSLYCTTRPYDLLVTSTGIVGVATIDFAGGTGRFASATGTATGTITVNGSSASFSGITGTIVY